MKVVVIEFFDSDGNPCVQPAFEAGANYAFDYILQVIENYYKEVVKVFGSNLLMDTLSGRIRYEINQLKQ